MSRKEYEVLFRLGAQLDRNYNQAFTSANSSLSTLQKSINTLSKAQKDIEAYKKQQRAVENTTKQLDILKRQYNNVQTEISESDHATAAQKNQLLNLEKQIEATTYALNNQQDALEKTSESLKNAGVNTGNLEQESQRLRDEITDLREEQVNVADAAEQSGRSMSNAFSAVGEMLVSAGILSGLNKIKEAFTDCIEIAAGFEYSMSNVRALSGASADELAQLSDLAKELGATTSFTAKQAADAMGFMGMAGWTASDMLNGMAGVLALAEASGEDLATTADIVTDNLSAFGLTAADSAHFSDVLAQAATKSNTNVSIMGETFKQSASIAGALGYSIEDVAVAVGIMANSGVKGSIAGTALKNTFTGLLEGVTLTSEAFGEYEFTAVNADGTMKGFAETIGELRDVFDQMSESERVANAEAIAGKHGFNGLLAILNATQDDYDGLTESINNCAGAARRMADIKLDNMEGARILSESAWDGVRTAIGERFTPVMERAYDVSSMFANSLKSIIDINPALVDAIGAFTAVLGGATTAFVGYNSLLKIVPLVANMFPQAKLVLGIATGIAAVTAGIVGYISAVDESIESVAELTEASKEMNDALDDSSRTFNDTSDDVNAVSSVAEQYIAELESMGDVTKLTDEEQEKYRNTLTLLTGLIPELSSVIDLNTLKIKGGTDALRTNTEEWKKNAIQQAMQERYNTLYSKYSDVISEAAENSVGLTKAQMNLERAEQKRAKAQERINELYKEAQKSADIDRQLGNTPDVTPYLDANKEYQELILSMDDMNQEVSLAEAQVKEYEKAVEVSNQTIDEASEAIKQEEEALKQLMGISDKSADSTTTTTEQTAAFGEIVTSTTEQLKALSEAYEEAYKSAHESVTGQYNLWTEAADVVDVSAREITESMTSQIQYWRDYNQNLQNLTYRSGNIEGLSDFIASFADGSKESVNAVAGLATATDAELIAMIENWKLLKGEQDATAANLANIQTNYSQSIVEMAESLSEDVKAMDMSVEAIDAGKATIQGFIDGAKEKLPLVQSAYAYIADSAVKALNDNLWVETRTGRVSLSPASETTGESVLDSNETIAGYNSNINLTVSPVFQIEGGQTDNLPSILEQSTEFLVSMVVDALDDRNANARRTAYA